MSGLNGTQLRKRPPFLSVSLSHWFLTNFLPAAKKVGNFVKTTGAKIAKFGLKVYATATKIGSRIANFIPVIGKPLSKAMGVASKVANVASDAIHVSLGKKLDKGMNIMNKIQNPVCASNPFTGLAKKGSNITPFSFVLLQLVRLVRFLTPFSNEI